MDKRFKFPPKKNPMFVISRKKIKKGWGKIN